MSALLQRAIARQQTRPQPAIDAAAATAAQAIHAQVIAETRPMAVAVLAWCHDHRAETAAHTHLVENLRQAIARRELVHPHLLALWEAVPDTVDLCHPRKLAHAAHSTI